jgi:hypothetical protein
MIAACSSVTGTGKDTQTDTPDQQDTTPPSDTADQQDTTPPTDTPDEQDTTQPPDPLAGHRACIQEMGADRVFDLLPNEPDTQIHPAAVFDGDAFWMIWNIPAGDGTGAFSVRAARMACNGTLLVEPFNVDTIARGNAIDPDITVSADAVLASWQVDTGESPTNLRLVTRAWKRDSAPGDDSPPVILKPISDGIEFDGNAWMPHATAHPDGGFMLVGVWASEQMQRFQVFVQHLDSSGALLGEPFSPHPEELVSQVYPSIATSSDGSFLLTWTRSPDVDDDSVVLTIIDPTGPVPAAAEPIDLMPDTLSGYSWISALSAVDSTPFVAFHAGSTDMDVHVRPATTASDQPIMQIGTPTALDLMPVVASAGNGGAVLWFRQRAGFKNDVRVQRFALDGNEFRTIGDEQFLNPPTTEDPRDAPHLYAPALIHVMDHRYLAIWSEGQNPRFRLKAAVLDLSD